VIVLDLVTEYAATRSPGWLALTEPQTLAACIDATRYYAAYGNVSSLSLSDRLPGAPDPGSTSIPPGPDPVPDSVPSLPVKNLMFIDENTELTVGEWSVIRPLFVLYVERENAMLLEASRAAGIEVYGRSVSEVAQDITMMETETLPNRAFSHALIEV
jgi:hypothetical protein